jgi:hypothetical protein
VLTSTTSPTASSADPPSVPAQPRESLDRLDRRWRATVDRLTRLSIQLHSFGADAAPERVAQVEVRLAAARRSLVEIETSLHRLRVATSSAAAG